MSLYDYGLGTLAQYELTADRSARTRGALLCYTAQGLLILREFHGSEKKLEKQQELLMKLQENGINTDYFLRNNQESLVSKDKTEQRFTLQHWYEGKECDTKSREDILKSVRTLARLHILMKMEPVEEYRERSLREEYLRHNQELRKIRKFIRNKGASNVFEKNYLASVEQFLERAQYAVKLLDETDYDDLRERAWREGQVCHGEYNQHNILMLKGDHFGTAVTNFGHWSFDIQVADLYRFMRKILENCCLAVLSISMVVSLTGCKIIENNVADAKKDIEQLQDSTAITTTENSEKINTEKSETTESDKKDNISDTMVTTEEISTVDDNSAKSSTNLESGGEKSQISEREWKDAYIEKIQSVKNEYSYVWGYLYDLDDNGIPELIISDWGSHDGESYTYTADGLISLGNMGGTFGHLYYRDGYLINRASSGGSPGPIWLTVWQLDGSEINTIKELEFDKNIDKHGEPLVTGAESYADAVNIVEKYGMSIDYQTMDFDGQSYCQVEIDTSALKDVNSYEEADFVSAVENYK